VVWDFEFRRCFGFRISDFELWECSVPYERHSVGANPIELTLAAGIVLLLVWLAAYFARRQWQTLRSLRTDTEQSPEDRAYHLAQAWRRLIGCALMLAFAGMLAGWYVLGLSRQAEELRQEGRDAAVVQEEPAGEFTPEQRRVYRLVSAYWIIAILLLMAMVALACSDIWAIRRYGMRHLRRIQSDRKAAIEKEIAAYRSRRNGVEGNGTSMED
jgi:hypothetical protein